MADGLSEEMTAAMMAAPSISPPNLGSIVVQAGRTRSILGGGDYNSRWIRQLPLVPVDRLAGSGAANEMTTGVQIIMIRRNRPEKGENPCLPMQVVAHSAGGTVQGNYY